MCLACVLLFSVVGCRNEQKIVYASMNIANGGFEEGLNDYWKVTATDNAVWTDLDTFHDGSNSLKIGGETVYSASVSQYINGLTPGYYYLEAYAQNEGDQNYCYLYGNGTGQGKCMTAVPVTAHTEEWKKVTVRGIQVGEDGILEIGMCADGSGQYAYFDSLSLHYEKDQQRPYESLFGGAVSWLDWVEDLLPAAFHLEHTPREFIICYLNEALENQRVCLDWEVSETGCLQVDAHRENTDVSGRQDRVFSAQILFD